MAGRKPSFEETTRKAVVDAFRKAKAAKLEAPDCYRAAIDLWCDLHPEHSRAEAARRVVAIVQKELGSVRDLARKLFEKP
jgi:thioredoxin-like negative regulator of GroEL